MSLHYLGSVSTINIDSPTCTGWPKK